jgi:hypothetical protein
VRDRRHCWPAGQATAANQRIAEALGVQDAEDDLGDEGDGDTDVPVKMSWRMGLGLIHRW